MLTREERINNQTNEKFNSLIENWNGISYKDKQKILSYLEGNSDKGHNNSKKNIKKSFINLEASEEQAEVIMIKKDKEGKVKADLAKLKKMHLSPEISSHLSKTLQDKEQSAVLKYTKHFSRILFQESSESGSIHQFEREEKCQNPKQELLTSVSLALEKAEKKASHNTNIVTQVKLKKNEFLMGKKTQKLIGKFVKIEKRKKQNEKIDLTKNPLKESGIMDVAVSKQTVKLLKDIKQYLQNDKSTEFNFDEYNKSINKIYNYHRNEMALISISHTYKDAQKKLNNISPDILPEERKTLRDKVDNLHETQQSKLNLRQELLDNKEALLPGKKRVLETIGQSVSHLISPNKNTHSIVPRAKPNVDQSRNL